MPRTVIEHARGPWRASYEGSTGYVSWLRTRVTGCGDGEVESSGDREATSTAAGSHHQPYTDGDHGETDYDLRLGVRTGLCRRTTTASRDRRRTPGNGELSGRADAGGRAEDRD